jgi:hypothetical protein
VGVSAVAWACLPLSRGNVVEAIVEKLITCFFAVKLSSYQNLKQVALKHLSHFLLFLKILRFVLQRLARNSGLPDFCWYVIPKPEKGYQISTKCTKWSYNFPNVVKIFQMAIKYINIFQSTAL